MFGDLRNFRNAIIHNYGNATSDVEKNEIFKWYRKGEPINLDLKKYEDISRAVTIAILNHQLIPDIGKELAEALKKYPV